MNGKGLIIFSFILSILSLGFPWVNGFGFYQYGYELGGYFFLVIFIYPLFKIFTKQPITPYIGWIHVGAGIVLGLLLVSSNPGIGVYAFLLSCFTLLTGILLTQKNK